MIGTPEAEALRSVFVGRQAELDILSSAMESARAARPQIVWIEGEAGIGKTAFMRRFLTTVEDVVILEASGEESETALDYGVVLQLVAKATPASSRREREEQIAARSPASSFAVAADLLSLLGTVQDSAPVVIAVDDAHWIDAPSAGALLFALRRLHGDRVCVVIVSRPDGLAHLGPSWSRLLADPDRVERIRLSGLSGSEVNQLADSLGIGPLTLAAGERLKEHTGGHPLYLKALLGELPLDRLNFGDGGLPAPHSFSATVLARLTTIGADAQNLVAAAAVAGTRCPLTFAAAVAGLEDPLPALEEALAAELAGLVPARLPEEIAFPHPLVRAAIYDDLSPTRRRALHLACAKLASGSASLAHRVAASHGDDDRLAAELRATAEAEVSAARLAGAVERLLWASKIAGSASVREKALLRAVECLVLSGDIPGANSHLESLLSCSDSARRSYTIGMLTATAGRLPEAEATFRDVMARPDYLQDPGLEGPATASLAIVCALLSRGVDAIDLAQRALATTEAPATARTTARQALALGLLMAGRGDEGIAQLESLSASRIEPEPFEADLLIARGSLKAWWGDLPGAAEDLSAAIRWSRAGVPFRDLPNAYGALAEVEYRLGQWDDGLAHADVAISLGEESDRAWDLPFVHAVASYLNAGRGNWSAAAAHVESARRAAEATPLPMCMYNACAAAAHLAWVRGEWDAVLHALGPLQALLWKGLPAGLGQRFVQAMAAEAMLLSGQLDQAQGLLDLLDRELDGAPEGSTRVELWRLRGMLEQARRRPAGARAAFEHGKEVARAVASPLSEGLLELAYGQFLRKNGSRRSAIAALRAGGDLFGQLGAHPFRTRCELELTACGIRPRDHSGENRYGLTAREDVVARLVASGKSNRQVAVELYLSTKAIEYHLSNVFAKVGVRSRHELAGRLGTPTVEKP